VETVSLVRMPTEEIADRRRLFELFTEIKAEALALSDKKLSIKQNEVIDLWSKMVRTLFALHRADVPVSAPALLDVLGPCRVESPGPCRHGA
jgi:UDP-N-acetylglucosamine enolpyruvyl transferase